MSLYYVKSGSRRECPAKCRTVEHVVQMTATTSAIRIEPGAAGERLRPRDDSVQRAVQSKARSIVGQPESADLELGAARRDAAPNGAVGPQTCWRRLAAGRNRDEFEVEISSATRRIRQDSRQLNRRTATPPVNCPA